MGSTRGKGVRGDLAPQDDKQSVLSVGRDNMGKDEEDRARMRRTG
jgi:hypothetical protein